MPDRRNPRILYVYNETTSLVRWSEDLAGCIADPKDPNTALFSIDVIKVPLDAPEKAHRQPAAPHEGSSDRQAE